MINRLAASLAAAAIATMGVASAAQAYEPSPEEWNKVKQGGDSQTAKEETAVGKPFVFKGSGFAPNSEVTVYWQYGGASGGAAADMSGGTNSMTVMADGSGNISVTIPASKAGTYYMVAKGMDAAGMAVQLTGIGVAKAGSTGGGVVNGGSAHKSGNKKSGHSSTNKLAKTGPESVAVQAWAGAGLVTIGGAVVAVSVIRRRNAGSL